MNAVSLAGNKEGFDKYMKSLEIIDCDMLIWVRELIAQNIIFLSDIPRSFRQAHSSVYVNAFRRSDSRGTVKRFIADLNVLCDDIMLLHVDDNTEYADELLRVLENALEINNVSGDDDFENYKRNLDEKLLQKLQDFRERNRSGLSAQLGKYFAEKR